MTAQDVTPQDEWKPRWNPWIIAVAVMCGTFMEVLDTTVANVILPHIAGSLSASTNEATWSITSYLVANAIVLPLTGWIGSTFGRKRFLMSCIVIFTAASALSGAAQSLTQLVLARIMQGLGGGAMQPVAQSVLLESFPHHKRGQAMAFYGMGVVVAPILGPILAGWLTDNYSWRHAFYINLPIGVIALVMVSLFIEDPPYLRAKKGTSVDRWGFAFLVLWISSLQIMLDKGETEDWLGSNFIVTLLIMFVVFLILFVAWEKWLESGRGGYPPVVDLTVYKDSTFAVSSLMITIVGAVLYASMTLSPLFLQQLLGYTSYHSGLAMAPRGVGAMGAMIMVGALLARFDGRYFVVLGFFLLGLSNFWLAHLNLTIGLVDVIWPNVMCGVGMGLIFVPLTTIANDKLSVAQIPGASGLFNLVRNLGGGVGTAVATTMLSRGTQAHQNHLSAHMNIYNPIFQDYQHTLQAYFTPLLGSQGWLAVAARSLLQQAAMLSYVDAFTFMGLVSWACAPLVFLLRRPSKGGAPPAMH